MKTLFALVNAPKVRKTIRRLSLWSLLIITILALFHESKLYAQEKTHITRDIQLLLSLGGYYAGQLDGVCNDKTLQAVNAYKGTLPNTPLLPECNNHLLQVLTGDVRTTLTTKTLPTRKTEQNQYVATDIGATNSKLVELDAVKADLKNTNAALKGLSDNFSTHFITQYNSLAGIGVTTIIAAIAIFIASGTLLIKTSVEESHRILLAESKSELNRLIAVAKQESKDELTMIVDVAKRDLWERTGASHLELTAKIAANFSGHCINLYKDNPKPEESDGRQPPTYKTNQIYKSYLGIALALGYDGYKASLDLQKSLSDRKSDPTPLQKTVIVRCLNNYLFYLAQRGHKIDEPQIRQLLGELEQLADTNRDDPAWRDYKDTIAWAKLHLGEETAERTKSYIESLIRDTNAPQEWQLATKERYDFYDRFPSHTQKVNLVIANIAPTTT